MLIEEKLTKQELFTTTEKRIADYIRRNIEAAVYMTIEELAKATYTSHSAIIRLCKKMGFSGFKEFRFELGREVHQLIAQFNQTIDPNFPFSSEDSTQQIAKKMADLSIQSIKKAQLQIEHEDLDQIGKVLNKAQRIFLFAKGDSQITARKFQNKEEYDFAKVATFSSQIAFDYVLNTLFSVIYSQNFEENIRNLKNKQELMQKGLLKEYRKT
ncbi:MurR/RpiR family transcriptional regulator [Enterococcus faecium]|uniref:MurR/RpiR family transcriptional regulator n=1 Tax=Enterococcus faecium TaxID=1352 RepID=UPI00280F678D|nr:MurR/RpiR family transcriptional regulator [Enterococcus faecium]MDQ8218616.1 MurR/RpiR family transcriptional regulator [Enterococcus faecium]MEB7868911.1 MurR/RpiR family transcriptional regulator [Enterococcus faecium]